jgi:RNA polymerase sigma factor for flagellar operon FliA
MKCTIISGLSQRQTVGVMSAKTRCMKNASPSKASKSQSFALRPTVSARTTHALSTMPPAVRAKRMLGTVRAIAAGLAKRLPRHIDIEDLVGAGSLGLADAYTRRATMPGAEFESFAACRIRGAMLDELRRLDSMPRSARRSAKKIAVAARAVEQKVGRPARSSEVATELGMEVGAYQAIRTNVDAHRAPVLFSAIGDDDYDASQHLADSDGESPDAITSRAQLSKLIAEKVSALPERMRTVLVEIYAEETTLKNIGASLGVTESRVCQIHTEAITALRSSLAKNEKTSA